MTPIPIDREHPPSRLVYSDGARSLVLRPWSLQDADALLDAVKRSLPALKRFMPWAHVPPTREGQYELIAKLQGDYHRGHDYTLGMFSDSGAVLGGVGLHARVPLNPRGLEVGYWCHSDHGNRGWTTLAVRMVIALGFDHFGCDRIQVGHDEANVASRRVAEKCGFAFEGVMRNVIGAVSAEVRAGGYIATGRNRHYALTPEDLPSLAWLPTIRASTVFYDGLGGREP